MLNALIIDLIFSDDERIAGSRTHIFKAVFSNTIKHYDTLFGGTGRQLMDKAAEVIAFLMCFKSGIETRLRMICNGFMDLKSEGLPVDAIAPQAAIYLTVKINIPDTHTLLLNEAGIGILPFAVFGAYDTNWYRISVGTCGLEDIEPMPKALKKVLCRFRS